MTSTASQLQQVIEQAALLIAQADGLLITAGAGIGIDSGLPEFRGNHGFWQAYPALGALNMQFIDIANPRAFLTRPATAWGFYGHRLNLYRHTKPHAGFATLLDMAGSMPNGAFVFTSNVDGQFQKAGFADHQIMECHGSIHRLQCFNRCGQAAWSADGWQPVVDDAACTVLSPLPRCPACGALARPNILMFGDADWDDWHTQRQESRFHVWWSRVQRPVVIEIGAGTAIATVRLFGESLGCPLIRINPVQSHVASPRHIGLPLGACEGIQRIACALAGSA